MNRQLKKSLSISLTAITAISLQSCMIPTVNAASSGDYSYDEFYFDEKPYWLISAYNGTDEDIVLPETKDGIKILGIAEEAFKDNKVIHSVTLPESYSYMGMSAFENSSVTSVNITDYIPYSGDGKTINDNTALLYNMLTPEDITSQIILNNDIYSSGEIKVIKYGKMVTVFVNNLVLKSSGTSSSQIPSS